METHPPLVLALLFFPRRLRAGSDCEVHVRTLVVLDGKRGRVVDLEVDQALRVWIRLRLSVRPTGGHCLLVRDLGGPEFQPFEGRDAGPD